MFQTRQKKILNKINEKNFVGNLVLTTELKTQISHGKGWKSWRFERQPFVRAMDEGLTLETSAFSPFTVANLRFQLS